MSTTVRKMPHHLVGIYEIAEMFGVSRQYADRLTKRDDFPAPEVEIMAGRVWKREAVERWAGGNGREILES